MAALSYAAVVCGFCTFFKVSLSFPPAVLRGVESDTAVTNAILTCTTV